MPVVVPSSLLFCRKKLNQFGFCELLDKSFKGKRFPAPRNIKALQNELVSCPSILKIPTTMSERYQLGYRSKKLARVQDNGRMRLLGGLGGLRSDTLGTNILLLKDRNHESSMKCVAQERESAKCLTILLV